MSNYPTERHRKSWYPKLIEREKQMLAFYEREKAGNPSVEPDGSFLMQAFVNGWKAANRQKESEDQ